MLGMGDTLLLPPGAQSKRYTIGAIPPHFCARSTRNSHRRRALQLIIGGQYARAMPDDPLPHPTKALTLNQIAERRDEVIAMLDAGGAILVFDNQENRQIGVLSRQQPLLDEASIAMMIDNGTLPPLSELTGSAES